MQFYRDWVCGKALPRWSVDGFDGAAGRFHERLDAAARPIDVPHRAMVQARQVYVFARADLLGWSSGGGALAERAMRSLQRDFLDESASQASVAFSIDRFGGRVSEVRDAYAHAFVLFAAAWLYRLNGDRRLLELADKLDRFVRDRLVDPVHDGVFDTDPPARPTKRQNPLMHLLEAYLALERAAPGRGFAERARWIVTLFRTRLLQPRSGVILEHFAQDWSTGEGTARVFEPGHHFEWVWLLRDYQSLIGDDVAAIGTRLFDIALAHGVAASGLLFDEVGDDMRVVKPSHRLWPHTEAIKAAAVRARFDGDPRARALAAAMGHALTDNFLDRPFAGGWIDQIDGEGRALVDYVPASSLYHLFFAAAEADTAAVDALVAPVPRS